EGEEPSTKFLLRDWGTDTPNPICFIHERAHVHTQTSSMAEQNRFRVRIENSPRSDPLLSIHLPQRVRTAIACMRQRCWIHLGISAAHHRAGRPRKPRARRHRAIASTYADCLRDAFLSTEKRFLTRLRPRSPASAASTGSARYG